MKLASALALAYVLLSSGSAAAQYTNSTFCYRMGKSFACHSALGFGVARGNTLTVAPDESPEALARAAKWEQYCKPHVVPDRYGVGRYVYAKPGCENGRNED